MNVEQFATDMSQYLPSYEARFWWFLLLISIFIVTLGLKILFSKKYKILSIWYGFLFLLSIFLVFSPMFLGAKTFEYFEVTETYLLQLPLWVITLSGVAVSAVYLMSKFNKKGKKTSEGLIKIVVIIQNILLLLSFLYFLFVIGVTLLTKPYIVLAQDSSEQGARVERIELESTVPVRKDELKINISPEQEYSIEYDNFLFFDGIITGFKIQPTRNYPPNSKVVAYFTGISNLWPGGRYHEQNLDFFTPQLPEVNSTNFPTDAENIPTNTEINVQLSNKTGGFVYWDIEIEPEAEYEIIENGDQLKIKLSNLKQGTEYSVKLLRAQRTFNIEDGKDIKIGELEEVESFDFRTTPPPNIEDFNRKSGYMDVSEPLVITFSEEIAQANIEEYFQIEPEVDGQLNLSDNGTELSFTPSESFSKNTDYKVTIKAGLRNTLGGELEQDNVLEFSTPGYVYVTGVYPRNYSSGVSRKLSSVSVTFNQPVDKQSAQSKFSISPSVTGRFSWNGNTMYYSFNSSLTYGTRYTVRVDQGVRSLYGFDLRSSFSSVFTTEEEVFVLDVPQYYQGSSRFACNLIATKMVLQYRGISSSEEGIKSSIGVGENPNTSFVEGYGTHWDPISSYISSRGVSNTIKRGWNVTSMLEEVSNGNPVILYWYNGYTTPREVIELEGGYTGYNGMHSEVVVGFVGKIGEPTRIILNDPWRGHRELTLSTFNGLWSYINKTAIVVY